MNLKTTLDHLKIELDSALLNADSGEPKALVADMLETLKSLAADFYNHGQCEGCDDFFSRSHLGETGMCACCDDERREQIEDENETYRWNRG